MLFFINLFYLCNLDLPIIIKNKIIITKNWKHLILIYQTFDLFFQWNSIKTFLIKIISTIKQHGVLFKNFTFWIRYLFWRLETKTLVLVGSDFAIYNEKKNRYQEFYFNGLKSVNFASICMNISDKTLITFLSKIRASGE